MSRINFLKHTYSGSGSDNTAEGGIIRAGGKHLEKTITLSANNTTESINVFQITGSTQVMGIHGTVTDATTFTNCTNAYFDVWDGTTSAPLTKITGANMSGFGLGSAFIKDGAVANALTTINNDQARVSEPSSGKEIFAEAIVTQKISTSTYIRFTYTTTDAPINAQLDIHLVWRDINGGEITAV